MVLVVVVLLPQKIKKFYYHLKTILISGFTNGFFNLIFWVNCHHQESDNHQSVADNLEAAQLLLQTQLDLGMA